MGCLPCLGSLLTKVDHETPKEDLLVTVHRCKGNSLTGQGSRLRSPRRDHDCSQLVLGEVEDSRGIGLDTFGIRSEVRGLPGPERIPA